jgi:hypothetical protein
LAAVRGALGIGSKTSLQGGGPAAAGEDGEARVFGEGGVDVGEEAAEELRAAVGGHDFGVPAVGAEAGDGGGVHDLGDLRVLFARARSLAHWYAYSVRLILDECNPDGGGGTERTEATRPVAR